MRLLRGLITYLFNRKKIAKTYKMLWMDLTDVGVPESFMLEGTDIYGVYHKMIVTLKNYNFREETWEDMDGTCYTCDISNIVVHRGVHGEED